MALGFVVAQAVARGAAVEDNAALIREAESVFERGEAGHARVLVDTVTEREGAKLSPATSYWRRLLAVSRCEKWKAPAPSKKMDGRSFIAMRLLDLEEARGRRFRSGEAAVGTVWEKWLADGGLRWDRGRADEHAVTWRSEREIWPDERHVSDGVRSKCGDGLSSREVNDADNEERIAESLLGGALEARTRERVLHFYVSRLLAEDRRADAAKWLASADPQNVELRMVRVVLGVAAPAESDLRMLGEIARHPLRGASGAAQARLLSALAAKQRWADVISTIATTPDHERLEAYRDYLSVVALDRRAPTGDGDAAVFSRVRELNARRRWLGAYRSALEAILVRRTADRVAHGASKSANAVHAALSLLRSAALPARRASMIDAVHRRLVLQGDVRTACALVAPLRGYSASLATRRDIECAAFLGDARRFSALVAAFADEESGRDVRDVFRALPALIASAKENAPPVATALLAVIEKMSGDADDRERADWAPIIRMLRALPARAPTDNVALLGRLIVERVALPLLQPPGLPVRIAEPEHFLWHRLHPTRANTTASGLSPSVGKSGAGTVSIGKTSTR